jgi:hypothetical protein
MHSACDPRLAACVDHLIGECATHIEQSEIQFVPDDPISQAPQDSNLSGNVSLTIPPCSRTAPTVSSSRSVSVRHTKRLSSGPSSKRFETTPTSLTAPSCCSMRAVARRCCRKTSFGPDSSCTSRSCVGAWRPPSRRSCPQPAPSRVRRSSERRLPPVSASLCSWISPALAAGCRHASNSRRIVERPGPVLGSGTFTSWKRTPTRGPKTPRRGPHRIF